MEELTKTQLILLALLVSFVTSIATGIVTVTLMDQAPDPVVRTINRIVERTVETVKEAVPESQKAAVVTKETTVVVKQEDLITKTIDENSKNVVRIFRSGKNASSTDSFVGIGTIVSKDGLMVTDLNIFKGSKAEIAEKYNAVSFDGRTFGLNVASVDQDSGLIVTNLLIKAKKEGEATTTPEFLYGAKLADTSSLKLGQTVISLSGKDRTSVGMGVVSAIIEDYRSASSTDKEVMEISTTLDAQNIAYGSPIFNIFGEMTALAILDKNTDLGVRYVTANNIKMLISNAEKRKQNNAGE